MATRASLLLACWCDVSYPVHAAAAVQPDPFDPIPYRGCRPNKLCNLLAIAHPQVSDGTAAPAGDAPDAAAGGAAADPAALYREWLQRQYGSYVNHLMVVVTGSGQGSSNGQGQQQAVGTAVRSAGVQVCAAAALMECVRSEQGPGVFAGALFGRLLGGVLVEPGVAPEVFALLFTKYLQLAGGCEPARGWRVLLCGVQGEDTHCGWQLRTLGLRSRMLAWAPAGRGGGGGLRGSGGGPTDEIGWWDGDRSVGDGKGPAAGYPGTHVEGLLGGEPVAPATYLEGPLEPSLRTASVPLRAALRLPTMLSGTSLQLAVLSGCECGLLTGRSVWCGTHGKRRPPLRLQSSTHMASAAVAQPIMLHALPYGNRTAWC